MSVPVRLTSFPNLSVEDTVSLTRSDGRDAHSVEIALTSEGGVRWWKGVELRDAADRVVARVETQDDRRGPFFASAPAAVLTGGRIVLRKAKLFGVHTDMYELRDVTAHRGKRLHFVWQRDEHRDGPVAGFFRDVGDGVSRGADAVAGAVETVAAGVGGFIADVLETVGTGVKDFLNWVGGGLAGIPGIGPILAGFLHWLGAVVSAIFDFVASFFNGVVAILGGVIAGLVRIVGGGIGGLLAWDGRTFVKGVNDLVSGVAGAVIVFVGKFLSILHALVGQQWDERRLTQAELEMLRRIYRGSIAFYDVRVVDGSAGVFNVTGRAFVLGNTVFMRDTPAGDEYLETLVHECAHVWQYQNRGPRYTMDAWGAQAVVADTYSWRAEMARGALTWPLWNAEAQAEFFADAFREGRKVAPPRRRGDFFLDEPILDDVVFRMPGERTEYADLGRTTAAYVRGARPWRVSGWL